MPSATRADQKGVLDLQARIAAEQGMLQNEQTKLQCSTRRALAQELGDAQRAREQVIVATHGQFASRFQPHAVGATEHAWDSSRRSGRWLNGQLAGYIGDNTARMAAALEPAIVTLATVYVMVWGYLQLTGRIEEPLVSGLRSVIVTLAVVLGVALRLWLYNTLIVDTFYNAPAQLAAAVVGAQDPVATLDAIWEQRRRGCGLPVEQRRRVERRFRLLSRRRCGLGADGRCSASTRCS